MIFLAQPMLPTFLVLGHVIVKMVFTVHEHFVYFDYIFLMKFELLIYNHPRMLITISQSLSALN